MLSTEVVSQSNAANIYFEPLLTDVQAAELLGIHAKTLQRMARNGQIPAHRIARFWRFRASELDNWLTRELHSASQSVRVTSKEILQ